MGTQGQTHRLSRAEIFGGNALKIRAHPDVFAKVFQWIDLPGRIHRHQNSMSVGDGNGLLQGKRIGIRRLLYRVVVDCGGVGTDRLLQVLFGGPFF